MTRSATAKTVLCFLFLHASVLAGETVELTLVPEITAERPLIYLSDVATTDSATFAPELTRIDLYPAPLPGRSRTVRAREIMDLLTLRFRETRIKINGASQVVIRTPRRTESAFATANQTAYTRPADDRVPLTEVRRPSPVVGQVERRPVEPPRSASTSAAPKPAQRPLTPYERRMAKQRVDKAILAFLNEQEPAFDWGVDSALDDDLAGIVFRRGVQIEVIGKAEKGEQTFSLAVQDTDREAAFEVIAEVTLPDEIAVFVRPLKKGDVVGAGDIRLRPVRPRYRNGQVTGRLEDAVGLELNRSVAANQEVDLQYLQNATIVRRQDIVISTAHASGVQVRAEARAMEDGGMGDLIQVETTDNRRERYTARVVGPRHVAVYAIGTAVSGTVDRTIAPIRQGRGEAVLGAAVSSITDAGETQGNHR